MKSLGWLQGHGLHDHSLSHLAQVIPMLAWWQQALRVHNLLCHRRRCFSRQCVVQRCSQGVDVGASVGVSLLGVVLLWRGVFWRTYASHHRARARLVGIYQLRQSEVNQHWSPLRGNDYIPRFDVAVDHALLVAIGEGLHQLSCPPKHFVFGQPPLLGNDLI